MKSCKRAKILDSNPVETRKCKPEPEFDLRSNKQTQSSKVKIFRQKLMMPINFVYFRVEKNSI